jgi:integrase
MRAIDQFSGTFVVGTALKLAALSFARPGEIRAAEWGEIDFENEVWAIKPLRRKLRRAQKENPNTPPHIVPLSRQAVDLLRELQPLTGSGRFLFPGARGPARPISENTINAGLRRMGYDKTTMTGHGFRHMASTLLNEQGIWTKDAIERQLSHKEPGVSGVYNKAELLPERRKMMQSWADYLDVLRDTSGKVVAIRSARVA